MNQMGGMALRAGGNQMNENEEMRVLTKFEKLFRLITEITREKDPDWLDELPPEVWGRLLGDMTFFLSWYKGYWLLLEDDEEEASYWRKMNRWISELLLRVYTFLDQEEDKKVLEIAEARIDHWIKIAKKLKEGKRGEQTDIDLRLFEEDEEDLFWDEDPIPI